MNFFGGGRPQPSSAEKIAAAEAEIDMVSDMFNRYAPDISYYLLLNASDKSQCRLVRSCTEKCIPNDYRETDLNKGESVCLDRCVSKFFEVNVKVSEKMQAEAAQKAQSGGGGMFGM
jgi:import inner membrane translocase subunit TIM10